MFFVFFKKAPLVTFPAQHEAIVKKPKRKKKEKKKTFKSLEFKLFDK